MGMQYQTEVTRFYFYEFKHVFEQIVIFQMLDVYQTITVQRALHISLEEWLNQGGE